MQPLLFYAIIFPLLEEEVKLNPDRVEKKSWTKIDKKGREEVWEWEEGPVLRAFRDEQLRKTGKIPTPPKKPD